MQCRLGTTCIHAPNLLFLGRSTARQEHICFGQRVFICKPLCTTDCPEKVLMWRPQDHFSRKDVLNKGRKSRRTSVLTPDKQLHKPWWNSQEFMTSGNTSITCGGLEFYGMSGAMVSASGGMVHSREWCFPCYWIFHPHDFAKRVSSTDVIGLGGPLEVKPSWLQVDVSVLQPSDSSLSWPRVPQVL